MKINTSKHGEVKGCVEFRVGPITVSISNVYAATDSAIVVYDHTDPDGFTKPLKLYDNNRADTVRKAIELAERAAQRAFKSGRRDDGVANLIKQLGERHET